MGKSYEELENMIKEGIVPDEMRIIHSTWKNYCLYMLNTTCEPLRSIWREKMITSILSWKYASGSTPDTTLDALIILSDLDSSYTEKLTDDHWSKEDWKTFGRLNISGKRIISISHYPQESLEKESLICFEDICERKDLDMLKSSERLYELCTDWNKQGGKSLTSLDVQTNFFGKIAKVEYPTVDPVPKEGTPKFWKNILKGANIYLKENIHSTSSWKRFCIAIMKNDVTLKYLGFASCTSEKLMRANAISAFSDKQEEKEKAKKEALKLAAKLKKEKEAIK